MIEVSSAFKSALSRPDRNNVEKTLVVSFPELNITLSKDQIIADSLKLHESLMSSDDLEIIGCNSSQLQLDVIDFSKKIVGKKIIVSLKVEGAVDELPLFIGYVDSAERSSNKRIKHIIAYDSLYNISDRGDDGEIDWEWYNSLWFPMKISEFRTKLFAKIKINQVPVDLPFDNYYWRGLNDNVYDDKHIYEEGDLCILGNSLYQRKESTGKKEKEFDHTKWKAINSYDISVAYNKNDIVLKDNIVYQCKENITAPAGEFNAEKWNQTDFEYYYVDDDTTYLDLIKYICQCNGKFGIINRYNKFEYRKITIPSTANAFYPGNFPVFYPVNSGYAQELSKANFSSIYKSCEYEGFSIKNITRVIVRDSKNDKEKGVAQKKNQKKYNRYIVQGNIFIRDFSKTEKTALAKKIYEDIKELTYNPFTCSVFGTPYLECGDSITLQIYDYEKSEKQKKDVWKNITFVILSRNLSGIQNLWDEYSAKGNRNQRNHITGKEMNNILSNSISEINKIGEYKFVSVSELPADADAPENSKTFYYIISKKN